MNLDPISDFVSVLAIKFFAANRFSIKIIPILFAGSESHESVELTKK